MLIDGNVGAEALLQAATNFLAKEWWPVPVEHKSKVCKLSGWPTLRLKPEELPSYFLNAGNIGVILGASGITDIDVDSTDAFPFLGWLPPTNARFGRSGNPGSHYLYAGQRQPFSYKNANGMIIERRSGSQYAVMPPSVHPDGDEYVWNDEGIPGGGEGLEEAERRVAIAATLLPYWKGGVRHSMALGTAGLLLKAGWPASEVEHLIIGVAKAAGDSEVADRVLTVKTSVQHLKDGQPIAGASLLKPIIGEFNVQAIASWLPPPVDEQPDVPKALAEYALTLPELCALESPEIEFMVEPFLTKASLTMVFAARGAGKTWFTLHLALCLARGEDFFGWAVPKPRSVLVIDGEMPVPWLVFRVQMLSGSPNLPLNLRIIPVAEMLRHDDSLTINDPLDQKRIEQCLADLEAKAERPELIIFDNLSSLMAGIDENSNSDLDDFLRWLIKLRARGYAVLFVHHAGKSGAQRGASRREDLLDTVIELKRQSMLDFQQAQGACFDITFSKLRGELPNPERLCVALSKTESGYAEWKLAPGQEILAYMKVLRVIAKDKPDTQVALSNALNISKQAVNAHIKTARTKGFLKGNALELTASGAAAVSKWFAQDDYYDSII